MLVWRFIWNRFYFIFYHDFQFKQQYKKLTLFINIPNLIVSEPLVPWMKIVFKSLFFTNVLCQLEITWRELNVSSEFQLATRELIFVFFVCKNYYLCNLLYNRSWWTNIKHSFYSNVKFKIIIIIIIISARAFALIIYFFIFCSFLESVYSCLWNIKYIIFYSQIQSEWTNKFIPI